VKNLLYKERRLAASPLSYFFLAFSLMTFLPGYPILVGSFFVCLGIFYSFQQARECGDVTYSVLLPVRKRDVVTAKYRFVLEIELAAFLLCAVFTAVRMGLLGQAAVYAQNPMLNANLCYLGFILLNFALFNLIFLGGFFKTAYKFGVPFLIYTAAGILLVAAAEVLHHLPGLEGLNAPDRVDAPQLAVFGLGLLVFALGTFLSHRASVRRFEQLDL
jgi:hypothetical protein